MFISGLSAPSGTNVLSTYREIIKFLLFFMLTISKQIATQAQVDAETQRRADINSDTIFLTLKQLGVQQEDQKRVIFTSYAGTGKTIMLKLKIREILEERKMGRKSGKVFLICLTEPKSILPITLRKEFEAHLPIEIRQKFEAEELEVKEMLTGKF